MKICRCSKPRTPYSNGGQIRCSRCGSFLCQDTPEIRRFSRGILPERDQGEKMPRQLAAAA